MWGGEAVGGNWKEMIHQHKSFNCDRKMVVKIMMMTIMMMRMMMAMLAIKLSDEWVGDVCLFLCLSSVRLHHWSKYFRLGWSRRWNCDAARFPFSTKYWGEIFANTQGQIWYNVDEKSFHTHIKWKSTEKLIQGYVCDTRSIYCPFHLFKHM